MDYYLTKPIQGVALFRLIEEMFPRGGQRSGPLSIEDDFSFELTLERLGGDLEQLKQLADLFLADVPGLIGEMESCCGQGELLSVAGMLHRFKGMIGQFVSPGLMASVVTLEEHIAAGDHERAGALLQTVVQLARQLAVLFGKYRSGTMNMAERNGNGQRARA
jgi:hypothetical protein